MARHACDTSFRDRRLKNKAAESTALQSWLELLWNRGHGWSTMDGRLPEVRAEKSLSEESAFRELIRRVRNGDQQAAAEVVRQYEPAIRRAVRYRLAGSELGNVVDSVDICQLVMASFFVRAAAGQYDLESPEQLLRLLVTMARNKLASQARKEQTRKRGRRRISINEAEDHDLAVSTPSAGQELEAKELLQQLYRRLLPDERALAERRNMGQNWAEIAAEIGKPVALLRKKLSRALDRVTRQLGLEGA
jgi:RNA polymerase sigma factor (sigma-70 family)